MQIAVDAKHKLIVEHMVTNQVIDLGLLAATAEPARDMLGIEQIDVVADRGYFKIEDIDAGEKADVVPCVPKPRRGHAIRQGMLSKDEFRYELAVEPQQVVLCQAEPADGRLGADAAMGSVPIVAMQPSWQLGCALV